MSTSFDLPESKPPLTRICYDEEGPAFVTAGQARSDLAHYVDPLLRAQNQMLHGAGVADGLLLRLVSDGGTPQIQVSPGRAFDENGGVIVLQAGCPVRVGLGDQAVDTQASALGVCLPRPAAGCVVAIGAGWRGDGTATAPAGRLQQVPQVVAAPLDALPRTTSWVLLGQVGQDPQAPLSNGERQGLGLRASALDLMALRCDGMAQQVQLAGRLAMTDAGLELRGPQVRIAGPLRVDSLAVMSPQDGALTARAAKLGSLSVDGTLGAGHVTAGGLVAGEAQIAGALQVGRSLVVGEGVPAGEIPRAPLNVAGIVQSYGAEAGLFLTDRKAPADSSQTWLLYANDSALRFHHVGFLERMRLDARGNLTLQGGLAMGRGVLAMGTAEGTQAQSGEVVGGVGFKGYGVQHGQLSFRAGSGFELVDCSKNGPRVGYPVGEYPYADLRVGTLHAAGARTYLWGVDGARNHWIMAGGDAEPRYNAIALNPDASMVYVRFNLQVEGSSRLSSLAVSHDIELGGTIRQASSRARKHDIDALGAERAQATLDRLRPVTYRLNGDAAATLHAGFIAEEVPDLVGAPDHQSVRPLSILALLTRVVQQQAQELAALRADLQRMRCPG